MRTILAATAFVFAMLPTTVAHAQEAPTCFGREATIVGTAGDDNLLGEATEGADVMVGLGGSDWISGFEGDDFYCGNSGNDDLWDYLGDDHMAGDAGNDQFNESATSGDDVLDGGGGTDTAFYEHAVTVDLRTHSATGPSIGQDTIVGIENLGAGNDSVVFIGDAGPNTLTGNEGRDRIRGKGGDDVLSGDELKDRLNGGAGEDTCYGTPGFDVITNCEHIVS